MQTICTSLQSDNHANTSSLKIHVYRRVIQLQTAVFVLSVVQRSSLRHWLRFAVFSFRFLITASSYIWTVYNLRTKTNEGSIDNRLFPLHNLFSTLAKACCFLRRFVITDSTSVCAAFNLYVHREMPAETVVRAIATEIDFGIKTPPS